MKRCSSILVILALPLPILASRARAERPNLVVQVGHSGGMTSVGFSSDGHLLLTSSEDGTTRLWEAETGRVIRRIESRREPGSSAGLFPDGRRALICGGDQEARIVDLRSGETLR